MAIVEKIPHAVVVTDQQQTIVYVNSAYENLTGISKEQALGKTPRINQSGHHDAAFYKTLQAELNKTGRWEGEAWDYFSSGNSYLKQDRKSTRLNSSHVRIS